MTAEKDADSRRHCGLLVLGLKLDLPVQGSLRPTSEAQYCDFPRLKMAVAASLDSDSTSADVALFLASMSLQREQPFALRHLFLDWHFSLRILSLLSLK